MIFEKIIEIAKYYDWESIFRGSLQLIGIRTNKGFIICSIEKENDIEYSVSIYPESLDNTPTPINSLYSKAEGAFKDAILFIQTKATIQSICNDIAQELITQDTEEQIVNSLGLNFISFSVEKIR